MKIEVGKIAMENDDLIVEIAGNKIPVNNVSLGGKSYDIGEEVHGIIIDKKFNIVRMYESETITCNGFIVQDDISSDFIHIKCVDGGEETKIGEELPINRESVLNYYDEAK